MERKIIKKLKSKNLRIFLIFVFIALILWFFNELNQEFVSTLEIPVSYKNFPANRSNVSNLPKYLEASVKANGYDLLSFEMRKRFSQINIDISLFDFTYSNPKDSSSAYILSYKLKDEIEMKLKGKIAIEQIKPDTLYFLFSKLVSKFVPVVANVKIVPQNQFYQKSKVSVSPDTIRITGPKIILDSINEIKTEYSEFSNVNQNLESRVNLIIPKGVFSNFSKAKVSADIEQFTEIEFKVNILTINVPDTVIMTLYPDYIMINCKVGMSEYENVSADLFEAIVDYKSIFERQDNKLPVRIVSYPSNIYSFSFNPEFVDYVIEKKNK